MQLPVQITPEDVIRVQLTPEEITTIKQYTDQMFAKAVINQQPSQWPSSKLPHMRNPNFVGIKGEWAGVKYFAPHITLGEFLADRPWKMSDMGDAIIGGEVFDYKTRTRHIPLAELLTGAQADTWMAELAAKFSQPKYAYLQNFLFCINREKEGMIDLLGWLPAPILFALAEKIPAGQPVYHFWKPYETATLFVPYRRLRPVAALTQAAYLPISLDMTVQMRDEFNRTGSVVVRDYSVSYATV